MRGRLDIYIHQPVANARESHRVRDAAKPELSAYLTKAFGENWHQKGQTFPKPKPGSREVTIPEYEKVVAEWREKYGKD